MTKPSRTLKHNITNMVEPSKGRMNQLRRNMGQEVPKAKLAPPAYLRKLLKEQMGLDDTTIDGIMSIMGGHKFSNRIALFEAFTMYDILHYGECVALYMAYLKPDNINGTFPKTAEGDAVKRLLDKIEEEKDRRRSAIPHVIPNDWPPKIYKSEPLTPIYRYDVKTEDHTSAPYYISNVSNTVKLPDGSRSFTYTLNER